MSHVESFKIPKDGDEDRGTFYCEVCHVEFNSLWAAFSHANGAEHQEKAQGFKEALKSGVVPDERMYGQQEVQRKEGTFYCEVCYVELNGLQTMMSHVDSTEHQEKKLAREAKRMEMVNLDLD